MHIVDLSIFVAYMICMLGIGIYFWRRNQKLSDYFVGGRKMGAAHLGLSVVATDVGGGFSIGLGGLGFSMGISGSWLLFTGLVGAILSAAVLIPHLRNQPSLAKALTFPDLFRLHYGKHAAILAAVISAIGYLGFTSSQLLAGAKLAGATFGNVEPLTMLLIMGSGAVAYTALGGLKAVIYTDTVQWAVLLLGLLFVGLPICFNAVGGFDAIQKTLPREMLSLSNISPVTLLNWTVTIVPIWFVGMTLYQRIYAAADEKTAKKAWYLAGFFEWPVIAFLGVGMGLIARVAVSNGLLPGVADATAIDPEKGLPLMLSTMLPIGAMGVLMSAYFSAILSTADSCLIAASGNVVSDILSRWHMNQSTKQVLRSSQIVTLLLGAAAILLATFANSVLDLMLHSYAFMVSGLFIPVLGCLFLKRHSQTAAIGSMLCGGVSTLVLTLFQIAPHGLNPNIFGIAISVVSYAVLHVLFTQQFKGKK